MNTVTQLARHAFDHRFFVTLVGSPKSILRVGQISNVLEQIQNKTCLVLDVMETFPSASFVIAQETAKNFKAIQNKIELHGGCLALVYEKMDLVCLLYPPTTAVDMDVERFYSADVALLVRALFPSDHSIIQWLDHTEAHIQKQRISNQIQSEPALARKKM